MNFVSYLIRPGKRTRTVNEFEEKENGYECHEERERERSWVTFEERKKAPNEAFTYKNHNNAASE